jgi:tetratricopeptide (TPR) repeat protein
MKNFSAILLAISLAASSSTFAVDCNSPPSGSGGNWARAYASWCQQCGGTYNPSNQSCNPGPNWGGGRPSGRESFYDQEAERQRQEAEYQRQQEAELQRQRDIEEQKRREEEAARKRREDFERSKQNALKSMKGIAEGELGLKGGEAGELGLKGDSGPAGLGLKETQASASKPKPKKMECEWGTLGASVVDLRCLGLDPNKPITVDPHIARGEERAFPAQPDPETFKNANYNKGFAALMRFDAASAAEAVKHFQAAQKERPKDPLVRNGLLLAQDILKARQQKERNDRAQAAFLTLQSYAAMMTGENEKARDYIAQARKLAPKDNNARFIESLAKADLGPEGSYPERKEAYRLVANGLVSIRHQNPAGAIRMLEAAQRLQPRDQFINAFLQELRRYGGRK